MFYAVKVLNVYKFSIPPFESCYNSLNRNIKYFIMFMSFHFRSISIFLLLFSLIPLDSVGQMRSTTIQGYGSTDISVSFNTFIDYDNTDNGIIGTPYLHRDWMFGELVLDDTIVFNSLFRYNLVRQEIELIVGEDTLAFQQPLRMNRFIIGGKTFVYSLILNQDFAGTFLDGSFFELVVDGNVQLLKKYEKVIGGGSDGTKYAAAKSSIKSYQIKISYYVRKNGLDYPEPLKLSNRSVINSFANFKQEVSTFRRKNSIRVKEEQDLAELFNYYNSLQ